MRAVGASSARCARCARAATRRAHRRPTSRLRWHRLRGYGSHRPTGACSPKRSCPTRRAPGDTGGAPARTQDLRREGGLRSGFRRACFVGGTADSRRQGRDLRGRRGGSRQPARPSGGGERDAQLPGPRCSVPSRDCRSGPSGRIWRKSRAQARPAEGGRRSRGRLEYPRLRGSALGSWSSQAGAESNNPQPPVVNHAEQTEARHRRAPRNRPALRRRRFGASAAASAEAEAGQPVSPSLR